MELPKQAKPVEILLVEDNPGDARLTQEALKEGKINNNLCIVEDGEQALDYLHQKGEYQGVPLPDLVLLDLNLPKMNGGEVLQEIKADAKLKHIPVVILTTSHNEEDILSCYDHLANCYIVKPVDLDKFVVVVKSIENFWLTIVKLPPKRKGGA